MLKEDDLPRLWILSPSASAALLNGFGAREQSDGWSAGVYFLPVAQRTALVALNQLRKRNKKFAGKLFQLDVGA